MKDERIEAYAQALFEVAQAEADLGEVEDELFRFARILEGSDELQNSLADPHVPVGRRLEVIVELLGGRAQPVTTALVLMMVGAGRSRDLPAIVDAFVEMSAAAANKEVAEVRSAIALTDDQKSRLADALGKATGKQVEVKVIIDPSIQGGLVARVGDTLIDGSVRRRLEQLRNAL